MSNEANALTAFGGAIPFSEAALAVPSKRKSKYLPRIQFNATASCKAVKDKKVEVGHWSLHEGQNVTDLGEEIVAIPLVRLDKAVDNSGESAEVFYANSQPEDYERVVGEVEEDGYDSGCMYGPYYLLFLVDTEQFVELFLTSTSARNEADNINSFLSISAEAAKAHDCDARPPRAMTLGTKEVTSKRGKKTYEYNVPTTSDGPEQLNVENPPSNEDIIAECNKFVDQTKVEEEDRDR